jgi:GAF domain-containing protein/phosphoserine phosphatase RsbU-like protein
MNSPIAFRAAYSSALEDYLLHPSEASLSAAYELARDAVARHLSVLDVAVAHQEAFLVALGAASDAADVERVAGAAGDFFLEGLSAFEMVNRGFHEARLAASLERRQTELSRQLSAFLADVSLADQGSDSTEEMLRLVAEQAREIVGAVCCVATLALPGRPRAAEGASYPEDDRRWAAFVRWLDLPAIYRLIHERGGSARIAGDELARTPLFRAADGPRPLRGWLGASLTALDGSELGAIQLFDKRAAAFTVDDESALVHLAQMASAAVERARIYHERSADGD